MKLKRFISAALTASMLLTSFTVPAVAEGTVYASSSEFISAAINSTLGGIESTGLGAAVTAVNGYFTNSGNVVSYKGSVVGYWENSALYADAEHTRVLVQETGESSYTWDPTFLKTVIGDLNDNVIENYVPTTADWSKIVGNYDVKLGDLTVPAQNWIPLEIKQDDELLPGDSEDHGYFYNFSAEKGIGTDDLVDNRFGQGSLYFFFYIVDNSGKLYVQDVTVDLQRSGRANKLRTMQLNDNFIEMPRDWCYPGSTTTSFTDEVPYINTAIGINSDNKPFGCVFATNLTADRYNSNVFAERTVVFRDITDPAVVFTGTIADIKTQGMFYSSEIADGKVYPQQSECTAYFRKFFDTQSCSKTVIGNRLLKSRLSKLSNLDPSMLIKTSTTGWYMQDGTSLDAYIGSQGIINAGDTADIDAVAEVEPMCFNVIVPTSLPIYVDSLGVVSVADNASITNKSNSGVKLTAIDISAKAESGWTLVDSNPSLTRDAKEFTFTTSLAVGDVLGHNETKQFTYNAELSPITEGAENLDLATVAVTVDWAD